MGKQTRAGRVPAVRPAVYTPMPEPMAGFQAWIRQQKNGGVLLEGLLAVGQMYVALVDGFGVPEEDCQYALELASYLYDLAVARGFQEAAEMLEDAREFLGVMLAEGVRCAIKRRN